MSREYQQLRWFFGAYFHQDWASTGDPPRRVVRQYARDVSSATLQAALGELEAALLRLRDPEVLRAKADEWGLEYDPEADGMTLREWLFETRGTLAAVLDPPPGPAGSGRISLRMSR